MVAPGRLLTRPLPRPMDPSAPVPSSLLEVARREAADARSQITKERHQAAATIAGLQRKCAAQRRALADWNRAPSSVAHLTRRIEQGVEHVAALQWEIERMRAAKNKAQAYASRCQAEAERLRANAKAQDCEVVRLRGMVEALRGEAAKHHAAIRVAQMEATTARKQAEERERVAHAAIRVAQLEATAAREQAEERERARSRIPAEVDYKGEYMAIGATVGACFPECEVTTLDLVRLLIHENATHRIALNLPLPAAVLARVSGAAEAADHE
jgi:FtsZ-binding cell division protein ZapB